MSAHAQLLSGETQDREVREFSVWVILYGVEFSFFFTFKSKIAQLFLPYDQTQTKFKLYLCVFVVHLLKTLVQPVLLYGCETWKITKTDERKLSTFQCQCLRRILKIRWQQKITNKRVVEMAEINEISCEVRRWRWNRVGHVLRREGGNDCFTALGWTPEGRRASGRTKTSWLTDLDR